MAKKGENIYKRRDGRWEARYIKYYAADGKAKYGYCYAGSYHDVREKVQKMKAEILTENSISSGNGRKRFGAYCDEWLMLKRLQMKESTFVKYEAIIRKHIQPKLGGYQVSALSSFVIGNFSRRLLAEEGLAPKTVRDILVLLKALLSYTRKRCPGKLEDIEIVYPKEEKREMRVMTREEQRVFTEFLLTDTDNVKFGILLTMLTGMRIGEICALRWADISLDEGLIRVGSTMQRIKNIDGAGNGKTKIIISSPKSDTSVRVIPLPDFAVRLCERFYRQSPAAFVLTGSPDSYIEPRMLQYRLERYTQACGLTGVHYHTLRHSFATRCVEVDFEIKSLSEILGHSSPKITLERYVHSSLELKRSNMNKLAKYCG